jgi:hypothetical protein
MGLIDPPWAIVWASPGPVTMAELPTYCLMPFQYDRNHWAKTTGWNDLNNKNEKLPMRAYSNLTWLSK